MFNDHHEKRIQENRTLLQEGLFDIDCTDYHEWYITITYYIAVHLIEKKIHEIERQRYKNHDSRRMAMVRLQYVFNERIIGCYDSLETNSRLARYDEKTMQKDQSQRAKECLSIIVDQLYPDYIY